MFPIRVPLAVLATVCASLMMSSGVSAAAPNLITNATFDSDVSGWTSRTGSTFQHSAAMGGMAEFTNGSGTTDDMAEHDGCFDISSEPVSQTYFFDGDFWVDYFPTGNTVGFIFEFFTDTTCTTYHSEDTTMGGFGQMNVIFNVAGSFMIPDASIQSIRVVIGPRAELTGSRIARGDNIEFSIGSPVPVELLSFTLE